MPARKPAPKPGTPNTGTPEPPKAARTSTRTPGKPLPEPAPPEPRIWADEPAPADYEAAESYLSLIMPETEAERIVRELRSSTRRRGCRPDHLLMASDLKLLPAGDNRVNAELEKIRNGTGMSPVLLLTDARQARLIIADGWYRVCAAAGLDPGGDVPCLVI